MVKPQYAMNVRAKPGDEHLAAFTLSGSVYYDEAIFEKEMDRVFRHSWMNVGRLDRIPNPGDFFTRDIAGESVIFIRGDDGKARGFYNVCRHRGTRLVEASEGQKLRSLVCPYHAWAYGTDGRLVGAPHTDYLEDFDKEDFGLHPVATETWGGFLWANLDPKARPLRKDFGEFFDMVAHMNFEDLVLGAKHEYKVQANWKILAENYSECYHCAPIHPGLNRVTPYLGGDNNAWMARGKDPRRLFSGGWQDFDKDYTSMTVTGYTKRPPLKGMRPEDLRRIYYWVVFPNLFFSLHPDYLMIHRDWPTSPTTSTIECEWYFDPDVARSKDFDPSDAVDMWDEINRQDWDICQRTQLGVRSRAWQGGRFSEQEPLVYDYDKFYAEAMGLAKPKVARKKRGK